MIVVPSEFTRRELIREGFSPDRIGRVTLAMTLERDEGRQDAAPPWTGSECEARTSSLPELLVGRGLHEHIESGLQHVA